MFPRKLQHYADNTIKSALIIFSISNHNYTIKNFLIYTQKILKPKDKKQDKKIIKY